MKRALRVSLLALPAAVVTACGGDAETDVGQVPGRIESAPTFPLDHDIWLAELSTANGALTLGAPREAVHRQGYDNQPYFAPDGSGFWFTALNEHTEQTDIFWFGLDGSFQQVTYSVPESEYSATPMPDGSGLSVVRVEADSTQRLWAVPFDGSEPTVVLPNVAPVGYHAWVTPNTLALFVLGDPPTLRIADLDTGTTRTVVEDIGRSIRAIPGEDAVSFVRIADDGTAILSRYDASDSSVTELLETVGNGDFHAWTPDGRVLMADDSRIYAWSGDAPEWTLVADLGAHNVRITRLAVSPDGRHIAMVVEPGDLTL